MCWLWSSLRPLPFLPRSAVTRAHVTSQTEAFPLSLLSLLKCLLRATHRGRSWASSWSGSCLYSWTQSGNADVWVPPGTSCWLRSWISWLMERSGGIHGYRDARKCGKQPEKRERVRCVRRLKSATDVTWRNRYPTMHFTLTSHSSSHGGKCGLPKSRSPCLSIDSVQDGKCAQKIEK